MRAGKLRIRTILYIALAAVAAVSIYLSISSAYRQSSIGTGKLSNAVNSSSSENAMFEDEFSVPTQELIFEGKEEYIKNCYACHGTSGEGDGPKALQLNPAPPNFVINGFKYGGRPEEIYRTISKGVPGSAMPSFALISERARWSIVHYIKNKLSDKGAPDLGELESLANGADVNKAHGDSLRRQ